MGLGCIDYLVHGPRKPGFLVVTDIDQPRLDRAAQWMTVADAKAHGVNLLYVNTSLAADPVAHLRSLTAGKGFNDVFVFAPVAPVVPVSPLTPCGPSAPVSPVLPVSSVAVSLTACWPAANTSSAGTISPPASVNFWHRRQPVPNSNSSKAIAWICPR